MADITLDAVKLELLDTVKAVGEKFRQFPWEDKKSYINWCAQTYYYARHTTCFIALMAAYWGPQNRERQYQMLDLLNGESGHDVLLVNDLKSLGQSIEKIEERPETKIFYQNQYYLIQNHTPAAQLGYAFLLEGIAGTQGLEAYQRVVNAHGADAGTFLQIHAQEDVGHFEKGFQYINGFNAKELAVFTDSLRQSAWLYTQLLEKCAAK